MAGSVDEGDPAHLNEGREFGLGAGALGIQGPPRIGLGGEPRARNKEIGAAVCGEHQARQLSDDGTAVGAIAARSWLNLGVFLACLIWVERLEVP